MEQVRVDVGAYATACEKSINKNKIDVWLNEGKSYSWISKQLTALGEKISDKSIGKYKIKRDERVQEVLMNDPVYQEQIATINSQMIDGVTQLKPINLMKHLNDTIEHCAELIKFSREDDVRITKVQDLRYVQQTMLDSIKAYGDLTMQAQKFSKINENPDLLRPQMNVVVKDTLIDMLGGNENGTELIDALRARLGNN